MNVRHKFSIVLMLGACATNPYSARETSSAVTPVDLVEPIVPGATGIVAKNDVIVVGSARPRYVAVIDEDSHAGTWTIPAGTPFFAALLGAKTSDTALPSDTSKIAWCDSREPGTFGRSAIPCLRDRDGDGAFDELMQSQTLGGTISNTALAWSPIVQIRDLAEPIPYRRLDQGAGPARKIGYRRCGDDTPARFASVIERHDGKWTSAGRCPFGERQEDGNLVVDTLVLKTEEASDALAYEVVEAPSAGALYIEDNNEPFQSAATAKTKMQRGIENLVALAKEPTLVARADPTLASEGATLEEGDVVLSVPVRHGITGVLTKEVKAKGWINIATAPVPAGTPVYGTPLVSAAGIMRGAKMDYTWCAPRRRDKGDGAFGWSTVCFPLGRWVPSEGDLLSTRLGYSGSTSMASAVDVERQPTDVGMTLTMTVVFHEWKENGAVFDIWLAELGGERQRIARMDAPLTNEGAALTLGRSDTVVRVAREDEAGESAVLTRIETGIGKGVGIY
ncbi:hypothetical protein GGQ59_001298 [Parvularcula dongshanensis]|uniref:Uncharacterized protein n=2 Tax=Parvularcula dongshanensis TaxID=1173995 RepID=A0A840I3J9_9PROT|nr:hypothetical protein [Parvularcula dongshanensis]